MRDLSICATCPYLVTGDMKEFPVMFRKPSYKVCPAHLRCEVMDRKFTSILGFQKLPLKASLMGVDEKRFQGKICQKYNEQMGKPPMLHKMVKVCKDCQKYRWQEFDPSGHHLCMVYEDSMDWVFLPATAKDDISFELQPVPTSCPRLMEMVVLQQTAEINPCVI